MIAFVSAVSRWPAYAKPSAAPAVQHLTPALIVPGVGATEFTSLCRAAYLFGCCFRAAAEPPEKMVVALKATLAMSYGSTPSLSKVDDPIANVRHLAPANLWYPAALTSALAGYFD